MWNCVPFHPHEKDRILSVRTPDSDEIHRFVGHLESLGRLLRPAGIIAIGRRAEQALTAAGLSALYIRHPSQGGARLFRDAMNRLFEERKGEGSTALKNK